MEHELVKEAAEFMATPAGYLILIPLFPLAGFLLNGLGWAVFRERWPRPLTHVIAVSTVFTSFVFSTVAFFQLRGLPPGGYFVNQPFTWLEAGGFVAEFKLVFDRLSAVMCLVVTGVGGLIHLYSTGYMEHDKSYARYFAYLNLFTFAMLLLVMGGNLPIMFVGWEGVGLCSYLLIGFWYEDDEKASAGKKAFIVNRIGDFGFLVGIFTVFWLMKTVDFYEMRTWVHDPENLRRLTHGTLLGISIATFICVALFIGATGKSAQIPLYVWLPDAMAGPTPVSALIHAATMVTAGVYMVGRLNFLYLQSPPAMMLVAGVGVLTALYSASIGFTQFDIKKVLAYSTVSQLGFMFTAMGVGAFSAGIFHLTTHAFFKALLFLGAGSVIHGMGGEQDMRKMGALRHKMPITYWTMVMAWLAIAGIFPFAGFFSKDEILWQAFSNHLHPHWFNISVYLVGLAAAVGTAIYMTRLMMLTFLTPSRMDPETEKHVHESPPSMTVPLIVLGVLSVIGGFMNIPHALWHHGAHFSRFLAPMWDTGHGTSTEAHASVAVEYALMALSVGLALAGILGVYYLYKKHLDKTDRVAAAFGPLYKASLNKYWVDEIYDALIVEPTKSLSYYFLFRTVDVNLVDAAVNGVARLCRSAGEAGRRLQNGLFHTYALYIAVGLLLILAYYIGFR